MKLGALINVANPCSILRSKFNQAPGVSYAERFRLHFSDCLRGRARLWQKCRHGIWIETDVSFEFAGESAPFELFDCPAVNIEPT